ncbi:MAG: hypothetical protein QOH84_5774 [Kribbellaceae bacterium]|nr:hypothetical protein [Kribbellaceae bacterium]
MNMSRPQIRKIFWDLSWGGRGMDALFALAVVGALIGSAAGIVFGAWLMGAGLGMLIGIFSFVGLAIWAHRGHSSPEHKH